MSELLAESRELKKTLVTASLDIEKAFDRVSHPHQLKKLFTAGLPSTWWQLKSDAYDNMITRVTWNGELGVPYINGQGNRQGGKCSASDFKEYTIEQLEYMKDKSLGTSIGPIH